MTTLSMQSVANLAHVRRPVVSMWRSRHGNSNPPFPTALQTEPLLFDAEEVAAWLEETGRGNNPDARAEVILHSAEAKSAQEYLPTMSALLLLSALTGELLDDLDLAHAFPLVQAAGSENLLTWEDAASALANEDACQLADALVDASFSGEGALRHLLQTRLKDHVEQSLEILSDEATSFLGAVLAELHRAGPQVLAPSGLGALLWADEIARGVGEDAQLRFQMTHERPRNDVEQAAWRLLATQGTISEPTDAPADTDQSTGIFASAPADTPQRAGTPAITQPAPTTYLFSWTSAPNPAEFFAKLEDLIAPLNPDDQLIVLGPTQFMIEDEGARERRTFLVPNPRYAERLRYTTALPRGMCRFQPRKALALWAFGAPESTWTVSGNHEDLAFGADTASLIASDISAALNGPQATLQHAFYNSVIRASHQFLGRDILRVAPSPTHTTPGGDRLARIWELDLDQATGTRFIAEDGAPDLVDFDTAARTLGSDHAGTLLPDDALTTQAPGTAPVIGQEELEGTTALGIRAINRLLLERIAPHARLTEPGDVVYMQQATPAALVDTHGGSVVQAPARIFRCEGDPDGDRVLAPNVVALDIKQSRGGSRSKWQLRTVTREGAVAAEETSAALEQKRQELEAELRNLTHLQREILEGLGDGTLAADPQTRSPGRLAHHEANPRTAAQLRTRSSQG